MLRQLLQDAASSAVLSVLPLALFAPPGHLGLVARFSSRSNLDRRVLQSSGLEGHLVATLKQKLHHLSVYETLDRLSVDVSDEVTCPQSCLVCRTALLNAPDHVMNGVDVTVSHVDSDGSQRKPKPFPRAVDNHRRPEAADIDGQIAAGRRVSGRGVG